MSQKTRVLAALRSRGAHGITAVDFAAGRVIDGQQPIMRVAARILELRADGHEIVAEGERDGGCCVYRLMRDAQDTSPPATCSRTTRQSSTGEYVDRDLSLWDGAVVTGGTNAIYGDDWDEAA